MIINNIVERAIPIFHDDNINFIREEKNGYFSIVSKYTPEYSIQLFNRVAKEITDDCDGVNSVDSIINNLFNRYPKASESLIRNDVHKTLILLSKYGFINWKNNLNPFKINRERISKSLNDTQIITKSYEEDLTEIVEYLDKCLYNESSNQESFLKYIYPEAMNNKYLYSEFALRQRIFNQLEEFYILRTKNEITGIISFICEALNKSKSIIGVIVLDNIESNYIVDSINFAIQNLDRDYSKISISFISNDKGEIKLHKSDKIIKNLVQCKFKMEAELLHVYGKGLNKTIYSYFIH